MERAQGCTFRFPKAWAGALPPIDSLWQVDPEQLLHLINPHMYT